jgi:MFS family permease
LLDRGTLRAVRPIIELWRHEPQARAFFAAVGQGSLATGAAYVAVMLIAYERLGSAFAASLILLAEILPGMLAGPFIGAWLDRRDRLRWAIVADVVRAVALAAMIVLPGAVSLLALAVVIGVAGTAFRPAAFALLPSVVGEPRRMAATAVWVGLFDAGMMIGPALAAGALVLGGAMVVLAATAALFAGSAVLFTRVRLVSEPLREPGEEASLVDSAREGLRFVARDRVMRVLVSGSGVIVLAAGMMNVAEVLFAQRDLRVGGAGFAALVAVFGVGATLGSIVSARSETLAHLKRGYLAGLVLLAAGLIASAAAPSPAFAIASFFVTGFGNSISITHDRGLLQHIVPGRMLSRAHALTNTIESWGFAGAALLGGTLATVLGARGVFAVSGVALLLVAAVAGRALLPRSLPRPEPLPA